MPTANTCRIRLQEGDAPVEMVFVPLSVGDESVVPVFEPEGDRRLGMMYLTPTPGRLEAVTVFLAGKWVGADVQVDLTSEELHITQGIEQVRMPLHR